MKAMLLAAGFGTRLRPLTNSIPKCLVPIQGKPLMEYWLEMFHIADISPVIVNLHYLADQVENYIRSCRYTDTIIPVYEQTLLGTAGTLLANRTYFETDQIFMAHGDNLSVFDMNAFIKTHDSRPDNCEITMMTFKTDTPETCGIVELDRNNIVQEFHEKVAHPPGNLANGAVYILEPTVIDFLDSLGKVQIDFSTEVLPFYLGKINTFHNSVYHRDIGSIKSYHQANNEFHRLSTNGV